MGDYQSIRLLDAWTLPDSQQLFPAQHCKLFDLVTFTDLNRSVPFGRETCFHYYEHQLYIRNRNTLRICFAQATKQLFYCHGAWYVHIQGFSELMLYYVAPLYSIAIAMEDPFWREVRVRMVTCDFDGDVLGHP